MADLIQFICGQCASVITMSRRFQTRKVRCSRCKVVMAVPLDNATVSQVETLMAQKQFYVTGMGTFGTMEHHEVFAATREVAMALAKLRFNISPSECSEVTGDPIAPAVQSPRRGKRFSLARNGNAILGAGIVFGFVVVVFLCFRFMFGILYPASSTLEASSTPEQQADARLFEQFMRTNGREPTPEEFRELTTLQPAFDAERKRDESNDAVMRAMQAR